MRIFYITLVTIVLMTAITYPMARARVGAKLARQRVAMMIAALAAGFAIFGLQEATGIQADLVYSVAATVAAAFEWRALLTWPRRKAEAGEVIDDLGPHPASKQARLLAVSAVLILIGEVMDSVSDGFTIADLARQMFLLSSVVVAWVIARSRVLVTTRGILRFDVTLPWDNIESYEWMRGGEVDFLTIQPRNRTWYRRYIRVEVPAADRPLVEQWLVREVGPPKQQSSAQLTR